MKDQFAPPTEATRLLDAQLASAIAHWLQRAPRRVLLQLVDDESAQVAALELGEIIVAQMTMAYPEHVQAVEPALPFDT